MSPSEINPPYDRIRFPEVEYPLVYERQTRLGETFLKIASWGIPKYLRDTSAGFVHAFSFPDTFDIRSQIGQDLHAYYAAKLAHDAMKANNWNHVDILIVSSITSNPSIAPKTEQKLKKQYPSIAHTEFVNYACHGMIGKMMEILREHKDEKEPLQVLLVGVESLSGAIIQEKTTKDMFGNAGAVLAFNTKNITHILGETVVDEDKEGVIRMPKMYEWPPDTEETLPPPPGYTFLNDSRTIYHRTKNASMIRIPLSEDDLMHMNGGKTAVSFKQNVPQTVVPNLRRYRTEFQSLYGPLQRLVFHPASVRVTQGVEEEIHRLDLLAEKNDIDPALARKISRMDRPERYALLNDMGLSHLGIDFHWMMDKMPVNNVSTVSPVVQMFAMIEDETNPLLLNFPTPFVTMGIGRMIGIDIIIFK